jgi:glutathionylspermidine synthase
LIVENCVLFIQLQHMKRNITTPRNNWQAKVEELGFGFHSTDMPYWNETAYYSFKMHEIDEIEKATAELNEMCLAAVQHVIDYKKYHLFGIPQWVVPYLEDSWNNDEPSIYGRMDICYKNGEIKFLEFNADTPTSLFEAGIIQWFWLQDFDATKDQFNSIHEKLIAYWKYLHTYLNPGILHFSCVKESLEDLTNTEYLRDCAMQAGINTKLVFIDDIGADNNKQCFVDLEDEPIANIFKLYPWEWMMEEEFGRGIIQDTQKCKWIEPAWKMILSNKAILPILWHLYPNHPYLLKVDFSSIGLKNYVKKPILSREGANIEIVENGSIITNSTGDYGKEGYVYQDLFTLPNYTGNYPVIGSWVIGQQAAGIGIRESNGLITNNQSRFVPHIIEDF